MKKLIALLLALLLAVAAAAPAFADDAAVTVEPTLIYEGDGIRVFADGECADDPDHGLRIHLQVENNSDASYMLGCSPAFINGFEASAYVMDESLGASFFPTTAKAGTVTECWLCTELKDLKPYGIDEVARLDGMLTFVNSDDWFAESPQSLPFSLTTSLAASYTAPDESTLYQQELYSGEGVRIAYAGPASREDDEDNDIVSTALLYFENNSDQPVTIVPITSYVNGVSLFGITEAELLPDTRAISPLFFFASSVEEEGIEEITSLECEFWIQFKKPNGDLERMTETGLLAIPVA